MSEPRGLINLIHRAPLDITYQHQIDFKSPSEQRSYWDSLVKYRLNDYTYIRRERRSVKVNKSFDELEGINYLTYQAHVGNVTKWFYCFVIDKAYVNDETTTLFFEIDVFQTYMFDYKFKPTYISQAHVDRWDANHLPIYSRTEESLDYGSEYITESAYKMKADHDADHGFYLMFVKEAGDSTLVDDPSEIIGNPSPYAIWIVPDFRDPNVICGCYSGTTGANLQSLSNMSEIQAFMIEHDLGNIIQQIAYVQYLPLKYNMVTVTGDESGINRLFDAGFIFTFHQIQNATQTGHINVMRLFIITEDQLVHDFASLGIFEGLEKDIPSEEMWTALKSSPRKTERDRRYESKLLCFPYRYNIFTDWVSTPALIKNEYISGDAIKVKGSIGFNFNAPRRFWIDNYRKDPEGREISISQLIPMEQPIITDAYYSYMLQNKNQISANMTNAQINMASGVATGVLGAVGSALMGNPAGAIGGLASTAGSFVNGAVNYQAMIRSENAKQKDLKNLPVTISNSNDTSLALSDGATYLTIYRKSICCEFKEQLAQYWHMYGYKINKLEVPRLRSRVRYNYIKTIGANIEGAIESNYLATLKAIFDNGVTIWHYSENDFNPLDYTYENPEVLLI